jgi:Membrane-fusion protein
MMKNKLIRTLITFLIIGGVSVGGFFGYKYFVPSKATAATSQYITQTAKTMNLQVSIQGTGTVYAGVSKDITANNSGTLQGLNLKVGDTVSTGTNLFTVDSNDLRQNVTKAKNNLQKQQLTAANAKSSNETAIDNLSINDAQNQLNTAQEAVNKMIVTSPINGIIMAENNTNGDNVQSGKTVLTVADPSSMKIKVSVDELNISKVKVGQKTEIKFDALKDKTYEGTVDQVAESGTTTNNVTTYDVIVSITNPTDIKIGMNANVNILVESKDNALAIPVEALIDRNGKKFVMVPNSDGSANDSTSSNDSNNKPNTSSGDGQSPKGNGQGQRGIGQSQKGNNQGGQYLGNASKSGANSYSSNGKLLPVTTGIQNDNYVEILDGINEGQEVLISLPKTSSSTSSNNKSAFSGMGSFGGNFSGGAGNGNRQQGGNKGN